MAINQTQLAALIQTAFDATSDVVVEPQAARKKLAKDLADAVAQFVVGRETVVTGTSPSGAVTGTGIIQGD